MTHPSPTAAPPRPRRGKGIWLAGRPSAKPRPASGAPHGVPGQARGGIALTLAALLLAAPAGAQIIPTGYPAADIALTSALSDQRVFLTCTALEAKNHQTALDFWQSDVAAAVALLTEKGVPPAAITAFATAAQPENLALPPDTPFSEVRDYCHAQEHWFMRWSRRDFTELAVALPKAFE